MSTFIDFHFRCVGDSKLIAKATEAIEAFKTKHAESSGNGCCDYEQDVEIGDIGMILDWMCYSTSSLTGLIAQLKELTASSEMMFFVYKGCTDGNCKSRLVGFQSGEEVANITCVGDIGMQAMLDIAVLDVESDSKALGRLITGFKHATSDWNPELFAAEVDDEEDEDEDEDEDFDSSAEMRAGVLGAAIGDTLAKYPELLKPVHAKSLASLAAKIKMAGHLMFKHEFATLAIKTGMSALLATVEKLELAAKVKKPKAKSAATVCHAVRL